MTVAEAKEQASEEFMELPGWKRMIVYAAGLSAVERWISDRALQLLDEPVAQPTERTKQ